MVSGPDILNKIRDYLNRKQSIESFREWVISANIEMKSQKDKPQADDIAADRLLSEIEGRYAEFSDGLVSEEVWRKRLAGIVVPEPYTLASYVLTSFYSSPSNPALPDEPSQTNDALNYNRSANNQFAQCVVA